jgi:hypothetical protein
MANTNADLIMRIEVLEKQVALLLKQEPSNPVVLDDVKETSGKKTKVPKVPKTPKTPKTPKDPSSDEEVPKKKRTSGYLVFSKAMRDDAIASVNKLAVDGVKFKNQDIMTELGKMWKALSEDEQKEWSAKAAQNSAEVN